MTEDEIQINISMKKIIEDFAKEPDGLIFFQMVGDGPFYIANRNHKLARGTVVFPKEVCSDNLKTLDDWFIVMVAIPIEKINAYVEKKLEEKRKEGN